MDFLIHSIITGEENKMKSDGEERIFASPGDRDSSTFRPKDSMTFLNSLEIKILFSSLHSPGNGKTGKRDKSLERVGAIPS